MFICIHALVILNTDVRKDNARSLSVELWLKINLNLLFIVKIVALFLEDFYRVWR